MRFFDRPHTRRLIRALGAAACCFFVGPMFGFTVRRFAAGDSIAWASAVGVVFFITMAVELSRASDAELEEREFDRELAEIEKTINEAIERSRNAPR